jgi:hypothetical protein
LYIAYIPEINPDFGCLGNIKVDDPFDYNFHYGVPASFLDQVQLHLRF